MLTMLKKAVLNNAFRKPGCRKIHFRSKTSLYIWTYESISAIFQHFTESCTTSNTPKKKKKKILWLVHWVVIAICSSFKRSVLMGVITGRVDFWKWRSEQHPGDMAIIPAGRPVPECRKENPRAQSQRARGSDSQRARRQQRPRWRLQRATRSSSCWRWRSWAGWPDPARRGKHSLRSSSVRHGGQPPLPLHLGSVIPSLFPGVHMGSLSATNQFGRGRGSKYSAFKRKTWIWLVFCIF